MVIPSPDALLTGLVSIVFGAIALINASKAKQDRAEVEHRAANFRAFEQAEQFYEATHKRLVEHVADVTAENKSLRSRNRVLASYLDQIEKSLSDLGVKLPEDWPR
jgi:hypothetical protein